MAELLYKGKITFSDLAPGLNDAAATLAEKSAEVEAFLGDRQKNVEALQQKALRVQEELSKAQDTATNAQNILSQANAVLEEAKGLTDQLADALSASGIYHFNYVGRIDGMAGEISSDLSDGLPDRSPGGGDETVAAILLIVGGDGGTIATVERIGRLFGQIGGNAQEIIDRYSN